MSSPTPTVEGKDIANKPTAAELHDKDSYILRDTSEGSTRDRYLNATRLGMTKSDCADFAGVGASTVRRWWNEADEAVEAGVENVFTLFIDEVRTARAGMLSRNLATVERARQSGDWKAASWILERHGYNKTVEVDGQVAAALTYTIDNQDLGA